MEIMEQEEGLKELMGKFNSHLNLDKRRFYRQSGVVTYNNETCWLESREEHICTIRLPDNSLRVVHALEITW